MRQFPINNQRGGSDLCEIRSRVKGWGSNSSGREICTIPRGRRQLAFGDDHVANSPNTHTAGVTPRLRASSRRPSRSELDPNVSRRTLQSTHLTKHVLHLSSACFVNGRKTRRPCIVSEPYPIPLTVVPYLVPGRCRRGRPLGRELSAELWTAQLEERIITLSGQGDLTLYHKEIKGVPRCGIKGNGREGGVGPFLSKFLGGGSVKGSGEG